MKALIAASVIGFVLTASAGAGDPDKGSRCSVRTIAGAWVFATDVGQIAGLGDVTAVGTLNIDRKGQLEGTFEYTIAQVGFFAGNTYSGSITVNPDCTATSSFTTSDGSGRTDSLVIVSRNEMRGMSQDPQVLWTFRAKRIQVSGDDD